VRGRTVYAGRMPTLPLAGLSHNPAWIGSLISLDKITLL
jgi:hypothetical protein